MEDLPNLLQRDYGLKPQGKSAPMSASRSSTAGFSSSTGGHMNAYDDVFGGPPKFTTPSFASQSEGYDDIFRSFSTPINTSSVPVFDAPVYDDDIFGGLKGVRSATVTYDDVFSGGSGGGPSASSFEDLLGEFGAAGKPSTMPNSQRSRNQGDSGFDDLIPGFGNSQPTKKTRSAAETRPKQRGPTGSPRKPPEDPFVVLESESLSTNASSNSMPDPFDQFNMPSHPTSAKERKASSNGTAGIDGINAFDGFTVMGRATSSPMNTSRIARSPLKTSHSASPIHASGSTDSLEGRSVRKNSVNNNPVKDHAKSYAGVPRADLKKVSVKSNASSKISSPRRDRQPLHENSPYVSNLNSQGSSPSMKSEKGANFVDEILVTVNEIKLLTQPTKFPPPSRPPPPLVIKQGPSSKKTMDSKAESYSDTSVLSKTISTHQQYSQHHHSRKASGSSAIQELDDFVSGGPQVGGEILSPSIDEEVVQGSSAAAASTAAMKEAMERAEAKLKLAKEARERKKEDWEREAKTGKSKEKERQERRDARTAQETREREEKEREVKAAREAREQEEWQREEQEKERRQREREREKEKEREREREREKDRIAVERATQEARERASAEARERAERAAVERATAEARERAAAEARERAEKAAVERAAAEARERAASEARERAAAEAQERAAAEKVAAERAAAEARLRAERAAVERANAEARERAAERAAVERAAAEARERAERAVAERAAAAARERQRRSDNDLESFFGMGARPNSAPKQRPTTLAASSGAQSQNKGFSSEAFQKASTGTPPIFRQPNVATNTADDWTSLFTVSSSEEFQEVPGESAERRRARLERHQRTLERAAKALAEKNDRDLQAQREQAEKHRLAETLDADVKRWATGKEGNLRALLSTLQYILWPESGWQPVSLTDVITAAAVKKVYRKVFGELRMALFLVRIALVISVLPLSNSIHQDRMAESAAISLQISLACQATQYPDLCKSSLMGSPVATKPAQPQDIIEAAFGLSADGVKHSHSLCQTILAASSGNFNLTIAAQNCLESLNASIRLISKSSSAPLRDKRIKDVKAWMSAALTRQYDARSAFRNVNTTEQVRSTVEQIDSVMCLTSNALSMADALDTYGNDIISWKPPQTERSNSSAKPTGSQKSFSTDMPTLRELIPNVIVSKDKSSVYSSIQAAVNSAPDDSLERFIIYIKAGIYEEIVTIPPTKTNIMFIGDGMDQTLITGSMSADQPGIGTYGSATVGVNADGFVARDIAFENAAGPESHQAVALRADCDLCAFQNCAFLGHQDTLYAHTLRQFYKDCRIEGTVDFIFGNSASVFHNCLILVRPRQLSSNNGETNTISAHGRTDPAQSTGFVFQNCTINGTEEYTRNFLAKPNIHKTYLGRPWKLYSRTVFMYSYMAQIIRPEGWLPWDGTFALDTLFYGEYQNFGPGANLSARVPWATQVSPFFLPLYSLQSFIQGDEWLSATKM